MFLNGFLGGLFPELAKFPPICRKGLVGNLNKLWDFSKGFLLTLSTRLQ